MAGGAPTSRGRRRGWNVYLLVLGAALWAGLSAGWAGWFLGRRERHERAAPAAAAAHQAPAPAPRVERDRELEKLRKEVERMRSSLANEQEFCKVVRSERNGFEHRWRAERSPSLPDPPAVDPAESYARRGFLVAEQGPATREMIARHAHLPQADYQDERGPQEMFIRGGANAKSTGGPWSSIHSIPGNEAARIYNELQPALEAWSGTPLQWTAAWGVRRYRPGAVLQPHCDKTDTHRVSAVIFVSQGAPVDPSATPAGSWPIEVDDLDGRVHNLTLSDGHVLYYRGAELLHGRTAPLALEYYDALFVHYKQKSAYS